MFINLPKDRNFLNKIAAKFFSTFFLICTFSVGAEMKGVANCEISTSDCEYYLCQESHRQCGDEGYLISFGHKYCDQFLHLSPYEFGPQGNTWLKNVRSCLIHKLSLYSDEVTCKEILRSSFQDHVPCYLETGFCHLPLKDQIRVARHIYPEIVSSRIVAAGIKVFRGCLKDEKNSSLLSLGNFLTPVIDQE